MRWGRASAIVVLACAAAGRPATVAAQPAAASPFDSCAPPAGETWTQERLLCIYRTGMRTGTLPEARLRLERLGAGDPAHPWASMALGYAVQEQDEIRARALYEIAASGFARERDAEGEVLARHNLRNIYQRQGDTAAAAREVAQAVKVAEASGQPLQMARAAVLEASHEIQTGGDIARAYRTLQRGYRFAFPSGPIGLRRAILLNLAEAAFYLGRLDETVDALEQHRALRKEDGSTVDAATVAFNLLNAHLTQSEQRPTAAAREQVTAEATAVLAEVQRLQRPALVALTHRVLADLTRTSDPAAAAGHLDRCLTLEKSLGHPELRATCLWTSSLLEAGRDPQRADRTSREAVAALSAYAGGPLLVYAWQARLRLAWQTMTEGEAMAASLQALDAVERLRARQQDDSGRAALFSNWTRDYYWLTGRLLEAGAPHLAEAFEVGERLRARVLLEHLTRAGLPRNERSAPDRAEARQRLQERIVQTQRRLLDPALPDHERRSLLEQLQLLEIEESAHRTTGSPAISAPAAFASLQAVRQALDPTEALLWFSIAPWKDLYGDFGGGSWVVAITRETVRLHRLSVDADLGGRVSAIVGLLRDREAPVERWEAAASGLGGALLGPAVAGLPQSVQRLVIISDGDLHALPFEALRPAPNGPRLGERFDVTSAPSATLWLRLRSAPAVPAPDAALVFADPDNLRGSAAGALQLPPLPWARREARGIARTLQLDASHVREGADASEQFLKAAALTRYSILHFAAHARADDAFPDRSAVFLTPGAAVEDGWLQPREIAALDLRGRLVVLSACESAGGAVLSGEGPLSLARAFFAAGAGTVVATRWPLRDDDAAFVMERFYRALGSGMGAAAALREARREAIDAGLPAAAWAGVALLGDGVRPPLRPIARRSFSTRVVVIAAAAIGLLAAAAIGLKRRANRTAARV